MEIATEHSHHCCGPGEVGADHHNIQVLSCAIQEALSENDEKDEKNKPDRLRSITEPYDTSDAESDRIVGRSKSPPAD